MTKSKLKPEPQNFSFENSLSELESIIQKMESGQLSLEDSLKNFEQGVSLTRHCQQALKEAEQKVQILVEKNGEFSTESFTHDTDKT